MNIRFVAVAAGMLAGIALAAPPDPALQVRNPTLEPAWVAVDLHPAPFDKVMLAPFELQFRDVEPMAGPPGLSGTRTDFPVGERERQELAGLFTKIFREELAESTRVQLVDAPGPGVLLIRPALRDIVSFVPPEEPSGRSYVYIDTVGEATLVVDFVDPASGRTLGTAVDRRKAQPAGSVGDFGAVRANKVGTGQEVRRLARRWATSLEKRVEQLYFEARPK